MIGPVLNGLKGRKSGSVPGFSYSDANKNSGIVGDEATFKEYSKIPKQRFRGQRWFSRGLRTRRKSTIYGASSSSLDRMARRSEQFSPSIPNARHIKLSAAVRVACYAGRRKASIISQFESDQSNVG